MRQKQRGREVTHDEASASARRLINSHFHNGDEARCSIPAEPSDDDLIITDYIAEQRTKAEELATIRALGEHLTDLVRYMRNEFHGEGLLTDAEYAALVADSESGQRVGRLESWDAAKAELRAQIAMLRSTLLMVNEELVFGGDWATAKSQIAKALTETSSTAPIAHKATPRS